MAREELSEAQALFRKALESSGLSQRELARILAGDDSTHEERERWRRAVGRWFRGEGAISPMNARVVAPALGVQPEDLVAKRRKSPGQADVMTFLRAALGATPIREMGGEWMLDSPEELGELASGQLHDLRADVRHIRTRVDALAVKPAAPAGDGGDDLRASLVALLQEQQQQTTAALAPVVAAIEALARRVENLQAPTETREAG